MGTPDRAAEASLSPVRLALCGTPGVGKSTLVEVARQRLPEMVTLDQESLASHYGAIGPIDDADGARPIDVDTLADALDAHWDAPPEAPTLVDGHLTHLLPVDAIVVLRCHPEQLDLRLRDRGWSTAKIEANTEHELLGGPLLDLLSNPALAPAVPWLEIDTSEAQPPAILDVLLDWWRASFAPTSPESTIDWISRLHDDG